MVFQAATRVPERDQDAVKNGQDYKAIPDSLILPLKLRLVGAAWRHPWRVALLSS